MTKLATPGHLASWSGILRARRKFSQLRALGCALTTNDDGTTTVVLPAARRSRIMSP
jgi:hypothetical protein